MAESEKYSAVSEITDPVMATDDWPARATATLTQYVEAVRDKTTGPALAASRTLVYVLGMALIGVILAVILLIMAFRVLVVVTGYLPGVGENQSWLANLIMGGVFIVAGLLLWRKRGA